FDVRFWTENDEATTKDGKLDEALRADPELKVKLLAEASGVLADMVRASGEFYRCGLKLTAPKVILAATSDYRKAEDTLGEFFAERVVVDTDAANPAKDRNKVTGADLHRAYREWANGRGEKPWGSRTFGEYAKTRLAHAKSGGVVFYYAHLRPIPTLGDVDLPDQVREAALGEGDSCEGKEGFPDKRLRRTEYKV